MPDHNLYLAARDQAGNKRLILLGTYNSNPINGAWDLYLAFRDAAGNQSLVKLDANYELVQVPPIITSSSTISAVQKATTQHTLVGSDANGDAVVFNEVDTWPTWVTLSSETVTVRPTAGTPVGDYEVTVRASDGIDSVMQTITITVNPFDGFSVPVNASRVVKKAQTVLYKDPEEILDYWIDFSNLLTLDEIDSISAVNIFSLTEENPLLEASRHVNGLVVSDTDGNTYQPNKVVSLWLTGGNLGEAYRVNVVITTVAGRTYDADIWFRCMQDIESR